MVRTAQTSAANHAPSWKTDTFHDHNGKEAIRVSRLAPLDDDIAHPVLNFQVYSTVPLHGNVPKLIDCLGKEDPLDGSSSIWEVYYVALPNVFDCVDHQRREIAYRKDRHQQQQQSSPTSSHLIPKVALSPDDSRRYGFFILITSDSILAGIPTSDDVDPNGPILVHFDRRFPGTSVIEPWMRLEDDPEVARDLGMSHEDILVLPEALNITATRVQNTHMLPFNLEKMRRRSVLDHHSLDYALDEDEGQTGAPLTQEQIAHVVNSQLALESTVDVSAELAPEDRFVRAMSSRLELVNGQEPDLHYIIYAPFAATAIPNDNGTMSLLSDVARALASTLAAHLPSGKSVCLDLHGLPPGAADLSSIIDYHRRLSPEVGAMRSGTTQRSHPTTRKESQERDPPFERYRTFAVVLDRPDFVTGPGVLLVMTDGGRAKPLLDGNGEEIRFPAAARGPHSDYDELVVLRSAGMPEVARRLGMLGLE